MGRVSLIDKAKLVEYDGSTNTSKCFACCKVLKGYSLGNIKRHYVTLHNYSFGGENTKKEDISNTITPKIQDVQIQSVNDHSIILSKNIFRRDSQVSNRNSNEALISLDEDIPLRNEVRKRKADFELKLPASNFNDSPINSQTRERDHSDIFGEHISAKHRKYSEHVKNVVEHLISNILFEADMGKYNGTSRHRDRQMGPSVDENENTPCAVERGPNDTNIMNNFKVSRSSSASSVSKIRESFS